MIEPSIEPRGLKSGPEASGETPPPEPIPHWPGRLISLGGFQVYVRTAPAGRDSAGRDSADAEPGEPALCVHGLEGSSRNWTDLI